MKTRLLLTLTALLLVLSSYAAGTKIGRIHYVLNSSTKTASVTYTGSSACSNNTYSGSITIPASVTYRGRTYSVKSIGSYAFIGCTGLTSVTIPSSVKSIGGYAFADCTGLTSIKVAAGNKKYDSRDNCNAIIETASNTLVAGCKTTIIPSSVKSIGMSSFYDCSSLTSVTIPSSVRSIGQGAFEGCTGLTSITIPNSVTRIGYEAFSYCYSLTSITACKIEPSEYNCSTDAFDDVPYSSVTLYVPAGSASAYRALAPWSYFSNIVETDLTSIQTPR